MNIAWINGFWQDWPSTQSQFELEAEWDGTGSKHGLNGHNSPYLFARRFSVVQHLMMRILEYEWPRWQRIRGKVLSSKMHHVLHQSVFAELKAILVEAGPRWLAQRNVKWSFWSWCSRQQLSLLRVTKRRRPQLLTIYPSALARFMFL